MHKGTGYSKYLMNIIYDKSFPKHLDKGQHK